MLTALGNWPLHDHDDQRSCDMLCVPTKLDSRASSQCQGPVPL